MELRSELVLLATQKGANLVGLCRRFGISRTTAYKWLARARLGEALTDRPRRPHRSPARTEDDLEAAVLALRADRPSWGGRKLARSLARRGHAHVPAPSTITEILRRHGRLDGPRADAPRAWQRFERRRPNELWQMDYKGHVATADGRCHPLTVLDDHSRYAVCLAACADQRGTTVEDRLTAAFRRCGLPERILCDNGPPWGDSAEHPWTPLGVWLLRLGIGVQHSRPYHPQTLGKGERFHRTLGLELLSGPPFGDLAACQRAFDRWRRVYNHERPHESLGLAVPAERWRPSPRAFPASLPAVEVAPGCLARRVDTSGIISFKGRRFRLPRAFAGHPVGLRPTATDGVFDAVFLCHRIAQIDLRGPTGQSVNHVPEHL